MRGSALLPLSRSGKGLAQVISIEGSAPRRAMRPFELLIVTAVIELGAGVALLARPSSSVKRLLGSRLETAADRTLGRVAGAALLALGVACALACRDAQG